MSTQLGFDLAGLIAAIERGDLDYQLALYAADAQVRVTGCDPSRSVSVYQGQEQIRSWLQGLDRQQVTHRLGNLASTDDGVTLTDLVRHRDGRNLIYQMTMELNRGQITRHNATVTWEDVRA